MKDEYKTMFYKRDGKANLMDKIQTTNRDKQMARMMPIRYLGLVLVQGSSALALVGFDLITYWTALWFGLLCYQITALSFYKEDNEVYRETLAKYKAGKGSSATTVNRTKVKRKREIVYIIGNTMGLILIGLNIINS